MIFYKTALKLHGMTSVDFDTVCAVLRKNNCNEEVTMTALMELIE